MGGRGLLLHMLLILMVPCAAGVPTPRHVVFLLCDDFGWANVGHHTSNPEIATPNIDSLYKTGIDLDRHYAYKICSPSRSSLQTGRHPVRVNAVNTGVLANNPADPISGFQGIPRNMTGIAQKLAGAGWRTHFTGKWDAGMATPQHTPHGRGYESFMGYFQHANNYWSKKSGVEATGEVDLCLDQLTDLFEESEQRTGGVVSSEDVYEPLLFQERTLNLIKAHNKSENLFLFHAFHLVHTPLNVPQPYIDRVVQRIAPARFDDAGRLNLTAMVDYMDDVVGSIVDGLHEAGMYNDTMIVLIADNGGPLYVPGSANNHPLKGGKYSDWEGGVRTNALISGGFIEGLGLSGTKYTGLVHVSDWYGILCDIAGVDFQDAASEAANTYIAESGLQVPMLFPVESQKGMLAEILSGNNTNLHASMLISETAVIEWPYKLVRGLQQYSNYTGPLFPNCSTLSGPLVPWHNDSGFLGQKINWSTDPVELAQHLWLQDCGASGCLYDLELDPNETDDLAATSPEIVSRLGAYLNNVKSFSPARGDEDPAACEKATLQGGFYGPWLHTENYYTDPAITPNAKQRIYLEVCSALAKEGLSDRIVDLVQKLFPSLIRPHMLQKFDHCL